MNCSALREIGSDQDSWAARAKTSAAASCSTSLETANRCRICRRASASDHQNITYEWCGRSSARRSSRGMNLGSLRVAATMVSMAVLDSLARSLRNRVWMTWGSIGSTRASATTSPRPRRMAISLRCSSPAWRAQSRRSASDRVAQFSKRAWATSYWSLSRSRTRLVGISLSDASRRATRSRSSIGASRSMSTRRSAVMLRSKALTRLDGRQTTSARRLNRAMRAREGAGPSGSCGAGSFSSSGVAGLTGDLLGRQAIEARAG